LATCGHGLHRSSFVLTPQQQVLGTNPRRSLGKAPVGNLEQENRQRLKHFSECTLNADFTHFSLAFDLAYTLLPERIQFCRLSFCYKCSFGVDILVGHHAYVVVLWLRVVWESYGSCEWGVSRHVGRVVGWRYSSSD